MRKRFIPVLVTIVCLLSLTGCWDHVEINRMLIIAGIGLDVDDAGETYSATVEFVNVEADGGKNISAEIVEGKGSTIQNAIQNAMLMTGGTIFSNHCKAVVIGDSLARKGIDEVIEIILRSPNFRKTVDIMVAGNCQAQSIIKQKTVKNDIVSYELSKILASNAKSIKNTASAGVYQIHDALVSDNPFFVVPTVSVRQNNGEEALQVDGCAVFAGEKMQGFLDGRQSKLLNIIASSADNVSIPLENGILPEIPIDVKITQSNVYLHPHIQGDKLSMRVEVAAQATLEDAVLLKTETSDSGTMRLIQDGISEEMSAEIKKMVTDIQSLYGADIFGFHLEFEDSYRREWAALKQDWESGFRSIAVDVVSDIRITGSGLIGNYEPKMAGDDNANALP